MSVEYTYVYDRVRSDNFNNPGPCVRYGMEHLILVGADVFYRVSVDGDGGTRRDFEGASQRAKDLLERRPLGETIRVRAFKHEQPVGVVRFRKVEERPPVADTPGVQGIDRWCGYLNQNFADNGTFRYAGICVCKPNSDHRDCAACDNFDSWPNMKRQRDYALENAEWFHTKYVILGDTISWPGPGDGTFYSRPYTGIFHAHVHLSVNGGIDGAACH